MKFLIYFKMKNNPRFENSKIYYNYFVTDDIIAGIVLTGPEVCAIREGRVNINEAWIYIDANNECWIKNMHISRTQILNRWTTFDECRDRKLLLNKREIYKLKQFAEKTGNTLIPIKMYRIKGFFKIIIGLCTGKKDYDKRETIKQRDANKEIARALKNF